MEFKYKITLFIAKYNSRYIETRKLVLVEQELCAYRQQELSVIHSKFSLSRLQEIDAKCKRIQYLSERLPELVNEAKENLWHTCLYLRQMCLKSLVEDEHRAGFKIISA